MIYNGDYSNRYGLGANGNFLASNITEYMMKTIVIRKVELYKILKSLDLKLILKNLDDHVDVGFDWDRKFKYLPSGEISDINELISIADSNNSLYLYLEYMVKADMFKNTYYGFNLYTINKQFWTDVYNEL